MPQRFHTGNDDDSADDFEELPRQQYEPPDTSDGASPVRGDVVAPTWKLSAFYRQRQNDPLDRDGAEQIFERGSEIGKIDQEVNQLNRHRLGLHILVSLRAPSRRRPKGR